MRLAAVMGLVIEEMRHQQSLWGCYLAIGGTAEPGQIPAEPGVVDLCRPARNVGISPFSFGPQLGEIRDHAGALFDRGARPFPAVEARHPLPVAPQDVGQGAMDRAPERAA